MTALPVGIAAWQALSNLGSSAADLQHALCSDANHFSLNHTWLTGQRPTWLGQIQADLPPLPSELADVASRNVAVALALVEAMQAHLNAVIAGIPKQRLGIVIGTSTSGLSANEAALFAQTRDQDCAEALVYSRQQMNATSVALQRHLDWQGPCFTVSTACSSAAKAILAGQRLLQADVCDVVLVGGIDTLCSLTFNGFDCLESLSAERCRPFGQDRDGINIGEAGALFLLHREPENVVLLGGGESSDAWHISAPHPEGKGAAQAMQRALASTGLQAADIDYVNLHGTATPQNDAMEALAIRTVFAESLPWLSSSKHHTGHCLGAAGAIEAAIACAALESSEAWLPWQQGFAATDPVFADLPFVRPESVFTGRIKRIMSNSFAFAGSNASLIFESTHG